MGHILRLCQSRVYSYLLSQLSIFMANWWRILEHYLVCTALNRYFLLPILVLIFCATVCDESNIMSKQPISSSEPGTLSLWRPIRQAVCTILYLNHQLRPRVPQAEATAPDIGYLRRQSIWEDPSYSATTNSWSVTYYPLGFFWHTTWLSRNKRKCRLPSEM